MIPLSTRIFMWFLAYGFVIFFIFNLWAMNNPNKLIDWIIELEKKIKEKEREKKEKENK